MNGYKKNYHLEKKFFPHRDLRELLAYSGRAYAEQVAFVTKIKNRQTKEVTYQETTYARLFEELGGLGTALLSRGLAGQMVAVLGENSYPWILAYFTIACGVGVTVPLDKMLQKEELTGCLKRSHSKAVFCDKKHYDMVQEIVASGETEIQTIIGLDFAPEEGDSLQAMIEEGLAKIQTGDRSYVDASIDPDALHFLLFTSGTTNQSKAVMLSHRNLMSTNYGMNCEEYFLPDDVNMLILPLHHIYGMSGLLIFLSQGLKNVFCDGLKYIVANLKEYQVTVITSVPLLLENMYKKIQQAIAKNGLEGKVKKGLAICAAADKVGVNLRPKVFSAIHQQLGGHMRFLINGAAALDPVVSKGFNELGFLTVNGYGLTETAPTIASETYRYVRPGSVGKVMPNMEARIDEPDENGIGELVVRGDSVFLGYYEDPEATAAVLRDGWFHTGDLAYFDEEEYLFICGRTKNVIVMKNGKNVFPEEIENQINLLPYVTESMVFTKDKANDVVLWVKAVYDPEYLADHNLTLAELEAQFDADMNQINEQLPAYKMVKRYFLSDRPTIKTTTMKTKRREEIKQIDDEIAQRGLE